MIITEILVTAYNGDKPVFVLDLAPEAITTVLTTTNEAGETEASQTSVVSTGKRAEWVLVAVREMVEELASAQSS